MTWNTPALYEDPSRVARMVVIVCAVIAGLLTFLIILPPLLTLFGYRIATPPSARTDNAVSTARTAAVSSLDSQPAKRNSPADDTSSAGSSSTAATGQAPPAIVLNGVATPQEISRSPPPPSAPTINEPTPEKPPAWATAIRATPDPGAPLDADAEPAVQPPLPRIRPHHVSVAGTASIPLPPPRPSIPTEAASTDREVPHERFDPF